VFDFSGWSPAAAPQLLTHLLPLLCLVVIQLK